MLGQRAHHRVFRPGGLGPRRDVVRVEDQDDHRRCDGARSDAATPRSDAQFRQDAATRRARGSRSSAPATSGSTDRRTAESSATRSSSRRCSSTPKNATVQAQRQCGSARRTERDGRERDIRRAVPRTPSAGRAGSPIGWKAPCRTRCPRCTPAAMPPNAGPRQVGGEENTDDAERQQRPVRRRCGQVGGSLLGHPR